MPTDRSRSGDQVGGVTSDASWTAALRLKERRTRIGLAALLSFLCVAVVGVLVVRAQTTGDGSAITVMTRNLYLGADINRPLRAAQGRTGQDAVLAFGHANHELREILERTNFGARSELLADEIAAGRPDLVGLQEVALWRHGPLQLDHLGRLDATDVDDDFLETLRADLNQRGVAYDVVSTQQESDVEGPAFTGNPFTGTADAAQDLRLTVRDVILVREGTGIRITDRGGARYDRRIGVTLAGATFSFIRGYAWADVAIGHARLRFVTTHLESLSADVALGQAEELLAGPAGTASMTTVLVCDCNSDPKSSVVEPQDRVPSSAAYRLLTGGGGFGDLWSRQRDPVGPGSTAGLTELVNDPTADAFTRRLDLILARPAASTEVAVNRADVIGDEVSDRDDRTGLWPSDHAGVVVQLRIT
jgi:endonuclease/exonuclease/phosphatase family metal-dependent hydrolase